MCFRHFYFTEIDNFHGIRILFYKPWMKSLQIDKFIDNIRGVIPLLQLFSHTTWKSNYGAVLQKVRLN